MHSFSHCLYIVISLCIWISVECKVLSQRQAIDLMMNQIQSNMTTHLKSVSHQMTDLAYHRLPFNKTESLQSRQKKKALLSQKLEAYLFNSYGQPVLKGFRPILNDTINSGISKYESSIGKGLHKRSIKRNSLIVTKNILLNISQKWDQHIQSETREWMNKHNGNRDLSRLLKRADKRPFRIGDDDDKEEEKEEGSSLWDRIKYHMDNGVINTENALQMISVPFGLMLIQIPLFSAMMSQKLPLNLIFTLLFIFLDIIHNRVLYGYWFWDGKEQAEFDNQKNSDDKMDIFNKF